MSSMFSRRPPAPWLFVCPVITFSLAVLVSPPFVQAVSPVRWTQHSVADFEKGKPDGVAVTARGGIVLARAVREIPIKALTENAQPFLWSEAIDSKGTLYVGSGNDGKVFEIPRKGQNRLLYSTGDLAVQALAVDSRDNLYLGTSPRGKVYRLTPKGETEIWFDPEERYIWALAVDGSGNLHVATGEHGIIYKVTAKGKGAPFFDSEESHIVALTFDAEGNLLAGSSGKGLLYRIRPDGKGNVILDTNLKEVNAVAVDGRGAIYASAIDTQPAQPAPRSAELPRAGSPAAQTVVTVVATPDGGPGAGTQPPTAAKAGAGPEVLPTPRRGVGSQVFRVDREGIAAPLWSSEVETVFSLAVAGEESVYLGTGNTGKIRRLVADGTSSLVARVDSSQVTALVAAGDGGLYVAGSNSGKLYLLEGNEGDSGTYVSAPRDATTLAKWGRIGWRGSTPAGTKVELFTRSGNSAVPDSTWSDWSPAYVIPAGSDVVSPPARFIQWKARLSRQGKGVTPVLEEVTLAYLSANLPPKISNIEVNRAGVVIQKPLIIPETEGPDTAFSQEPEAPEGAEIPSAYPLIPGKKVYQRGMRSLSWEGTDPNRDALRYDLSYRGEGEREWKPLARGLKEGYFAWDSTLLPDGRYRVRIVATDSPSNPPGAEKQGQELTPAFIIDNTPPRVESTAQEESKSKVAVVAVSDTTSPIRSLEYSVDASPWVPVFPRDGVADSTSEEYRVPLGRLEEGEHTVLFKATDAEGNVGTGKLVIPGS